MLAFSCPGLLSARSAREHEPKKQSRDVEATAGTWIGRIAFNYLMTPSSLALEIRFLLRHFWNSSVPRPGRLIHRLRSQTTGATSDQPVTVVIRSLVCTPCMNGYIQDRTDSAMDSPLARISARWWGIDGARFSSL